MRLLNTSTLALKEFFPSPETPPWEDRLKYAILSHTWGEEEILFEHVRKNVDLEALRQMKGFAKVNGSCERARKDGYEYIWIDTCCIDKSSSAELSEAINSMWQWYRDSGVCYAYLADATKGDQRSFRWSRWFARGWTLQELVAPEVLLFYDKNWEHIGSRRSEAALIAEITGIRSHVLLRNSRPGHTHDIKVSNRRCVTCGAATSIDDILRSTSVATKMSWSSKRKTTRIEDRSYCLLGLFSVYMPLLYGEGDRAWLRLIEEIIKGTNDQSILAFSYCTHDYMDRPTRQLSTGGIYALDASYFASNIEVTENRSSKTMGMVAGELVIDLWICPLRIDPSEPVRSAGVSNWEKYEDALIGILDCCVTGEFLNSPVLLLKRLPNDKFMRLPDFCPLKVVYEDEKASLAWCKADMFQNYLERGLFDTEIRQYMSCDIAKAVRQSITIVNIQFHDISYDTKPLRIMPILQPHDLSYEMDSSYPASDHGYVWRVPIPIVNYGYGTAMFSNKSQLPFLVTWGLSVSPSRPGELWCRVSALDGMDTEEYSKTNQTSILRARALDSHNRLNQSTRELPEGYRKSQRNLHLGDLRIQTDIKEVKILDRALWQLFIRITRVKG